MTDTENDIIFLNLKYPMKRIELSFCHELFHLVHGNQGEKFSDAKTYDHLRLHGKAVCTHEEIKSISA